MDTTILMQNSKLIESQNSIHPNENDTRKKLADHQHHLYQVQMMTIYQIDIILRKSKGRYKINHLEEITMMIKAHKTKISSTSKYLILKEINY